MLRLFTATTMLLVNLFVAGQLSAQTLIVLNDDNGGMDLLEPTVFIRQLISGGAIGGKDRLAA